MVQAISIRQVGYINHRCLVFKGACKLHAAMLGTRNSLSTGKDPDALQADGEPQVLGPLLLGGLFYVEQIRTVAVPVVDDIHVGAAGIVARQTLQLLPLVDNVCLDFGQVL